MVSQYCNWQLNQYTRHYWYKQSMLFANEHATKYPIIHRKGVVVTRKQDEEYPIGNH